MNRLVTLSAAAGLSLGALVFVGCQNEDTNRDTFGNAQTSNDVSTGSASSADSSTYNGTHSGDRNEEPGRGLSSTNLETHGGPSRITGGENVDRNGIGVTDDMRAASASGPLDSSARTRDRSSDVTVPTTQPSDAIPTTQPSIEISR